MPGYNDELKRDMYRDIAAKAHMQARMSHARVSFACDATETETAAEYSARMLSAMGLKAGRDPIADLTMYLQGRDMGARDLRHAGMDAAHHTLEGTAVDAFFASFGK